MYTSDRESSLALIRMVNDLPSLPDRYALIRAALDNPRAGAAELARIIGTDQATSAMVLKFANSPMYNPMGQPIASLPIAITRLGTRETAHIALTMSLLYGFALPTGMGRVRSFWVHAFAVGLLCKQMGALLDLDQDTMFTIGLLHDIGRAILGIRIDMDYFESTVGGMHDGGLIETERREYGLDHAEAGAETLRLWQFPWLICETVGIHHAEQPATPHAHVLQLADDEAHRCIQWDTAIDRVEGILLENPQRPRELLESAGLLEPLPEETEG